MKDPIFFSHLHDETDLDDAQPPIRRLLHRPQIV
jgi:hypothetical protein